MVRALGIEMPSGLLFIADEVTLATKWARDPRDLRHVPRRAVIFRTQAPDSARHHTKRRPAHVAQSERSPSRFLCRTSELRQPAALGGIPPRLVVKKTVAGVHRRHPIGLETRVNGPLTIGAAVGCIV